MHRLLVVLLAVLSVARPVFADDVTNTESGVKQRLADASASITRLDGQVAALETSIAETQKRSDREREQLRILARVLYAQPAGDNLLMTVLSANSVSDAFTRMGDLASAAQEASRTRGALNRDLANLSAQRAQLVSDRQHQVKVQAQLQEEFNRLVELEAQRVEQARLAALKAATPTPAAAQAATPAAGPARTPAPAPAPAPPPAPPPTAAGGSIQQIILDAFAPLGAGGEARGAGGRAAVGAARGQVRVLLQPQRRQPELRRFRALPVPALDLGLHAPAQPVRLQPGRQRAGRRSPLPALRPQPVVL